MKKFFPLFIVATFFCLFLFCSKSAWAAQVSSSPKASDDHAATQVDENTPSVTYTITELKPNTKYTAIGVGKTFISDGSGKVIITVCGDGEKNVKLNCDNNDYFHGGSTYAISLYESDNLKKVVDESQTKFYVKYVYPTVSSIQPENPRPNEPISIILTGGYVKQASDLDKRNNYAIVLEGTGVTSASFEKQKQCITLKSDGSMTDAKGNPISSVSFGTTDNPLITGTYTLSIKEQSNEGGITHENCGEGFTYYSSAIEVSANGGTVGDIVQDPNGQELPSMDYAEQVSPPPPPCSDNLCRTAIGNIPVGSANQIFSFIFSWLLGIAASLAVIFLVYGGFLLLTSRGDKEKITTARDRITSAIIGFIFIVLSILILQIIGVDILHIPGWIS